MGQLYAYAAKPPYSIFPLLRILPTYLTYPVNKTSQHFELRS